MPHPLTVLRARDSRAGFPSPNAMQSHLRRRDAGGTLDGALRLYRRHPGAPPRSRAARTCGSVGRAACISTPPPADPPSRARPG
ncbi:MAG TPA: hypothetical protein VM759_09445, partial [Longimicrobium sp.]|nr:hypothetical protein [Longimicrobium sp.]